MNTNTSIFDVFEACYRAQQSGELIESISETDKEFHFQNWFKKCLINLGILFDEPRRNAYPDFRLVEFPEGYEIKGLAYPGRERDYDSNSQIPTGLHNGRKIFYVFGRYPADLAEYPANTMGHRKYPLIDMVICHGDFLNADYTYVHKNKNVKGFGIYGDIMIRDRKMYVAPTPFALTEGTTGLVTLILPDTYVSDERYQAVGKLVRYEAEELVVGYSFDLRTNTIVSKYAQNPNARNKHVFIAYRLKG